MDKKHIISIIADLENMILDAKEWLYGNLILLKDRVQNNKHDHSDRERLVWKLIEYIDKLCPVCAKYIEKEDWSYCSYECFNNRKVKDDRISHTHPIISTGK